MLRFPSVRLPTALFPRSAILATLFMASALPPGCGGGGGGGGGVDAGPAFWAIPFVPTSASRDVWIGARNVDTSSTTVTFSAYRPDGTAYAPATAFSIDGQGELVISLSTALSGFAAAGGVIYADTPSRRVEVWFDVEIAAEVAAETSRAFALPDLAAPPPGPFRTGVNATTLTTSIQIANASAAPAPISVTAYEESLVDPLAPPVSLVVVLAPFAAGESRVFTPDALSGITGFVGSFLVESPAPVVAAAEEDLAFDIPRVATSDRTVAATVSFGRDPQTAFASYLDFVLVVRNDNDSPETVRLTSIHRANGTAMFASGRDISLAAHESRVILTTDPPLVDLFGDVLAASTFDSFSVQLSVPAGVDVGLRQFEPEFLAANMKVDPTPLGHVQIVSDVYTLATLPSPVRTFANVYNPNNVSITVVAEAVVPQPSGFDSSIEPIATLTIPAHAQAEISSDGTIYADRDLVLVDFIGLRFRSNAAFTVTARREIRDSGNAVETLVPLPVRSLDDGE